MGELNRDVSSSKEQDRARTINTASPRKAGERAEVCKHVRNARTFANCRTAAPIRARFACLDRAPWHGLDLSQTAQEKP